jgi:two-component system CheB/CheR fusion protein
VLNLAAAGGTELGSLVEVIVRPLAPDRARLIAAGPPIMLPAETGTGLALVLHELATNAVKYGAWATGGSVVSIAWNLDPRKLLVIVWHEACPVATPPTREGFGSTLIKRALNEAQVRLDIGPSGVDCRIELQL